MNLTGSFIFLFLLNLATPNIGINFLEKNWPELDYSRKYQKHRHMCICRKTSISCTEFHLFSRHGDKSENTIIRPLLSWGLHFHRKQK